MSGDKMRCNHCLDVLEAGELYEVDKDRLNWICPGCKTKNAFPVYTEGTKHDSGKLMWRLLPIKQLHDVIKVFMHGLTKYKEDDWQLVENAKNRYYDAAQRHLTDWRLGKKKDKDSKLPTLAHAVASVLILMWHDRRKS